MSLRIATTIFFFSLGLSIVLQMQESPTATGTVTDIHDLLPLYGFPKGLIPNNVISYTLSHDGFFQIQLQTPCYVHFDDDHLVYYDDQIKGKLSYGSVSDVSGIQAKKLFLWLPVTGMQVDQDSGTLEFFVGALSQKFPAKQFEEIPGCASKARKELVLTTPRSLASV